MSVRGEKDVESYVYIDLVFLVNCLTDYLILLASGKIGGYRVEPVRLVMASVLGSLYAASSFVVPLPSFYSVPARLAAGLLMVLMAYPRVKGVHFVGLAMSFFLCSAITGGVALALYTRGIPAAKGFAQRYLTDSGGSASVWTLAVSLIFISGLPLVLKLAGGRNSSPPLIAVDLVFGKERVSLLGLVDTGNELRDPVSGLPVVVVDMESIDHLIPIELRSFFSSSWDRIPQNIQGTFFEKRLRLIPYSYVGGQRGVLPGFKPDYLVVTEKNGAKLEREVVVGVTFSPLSPQGLYHALLHPEVVRQ